MLGILGAPAIVPSRVLAQTDLPDQPLRILVGYAAGGGAELLARVIAPQLERRIGRRVAIHNLPSGTGATAGEIFRKALTSGSVVAFLPSTTLDSKLAGTAFPFDSQSSLVPLTVAGTLQIAAAASPGIGVSTFPEYLTWLKAAAPARARLGVTATDAYLSIYGRMIGREIGVDFEIVPHRGASGLVTALKEDKIAAGLGSLTTLMQHNFDRQVMILMTSGRKRSRLLPDVPTVVELGYPALELEEWYGFFASSASPISVMAEWNRQLRAVLAQSEVIAALAQLGLDVETSTQEEAAARLATHVHAWRARKESFGISPVD